MADTFCNAVGEIYRRMKRTGATMVGSFPADMYNFDHSSAGTPLEMVGLCLDEVNRPEITDRRIAEWVDLIKKS